MKTDKEKELDDIFKGGLENPSMNTNFREGDWDAMEALLDHNKKRRGIVYWLPIVSGVAAMLLLALGWFLLKNNNDKPLITKNPTVIEGTTPKTNGSITGSTTAQPNLADVNTHTTNTVSAGTSSQVVNGPAHKRDTISLKNRVASTRYVADAQNVKNNRKATGGPAASQQPNEAIVNAPTENDLVAMGNGKEILTANNAALDLSVSNTELSANTALPTNKPEIMAAYVKDKNSVVIKPFNPNRPQFALTVFASPDINGVNTFQNSQVGTNAGLMFSMGLGKKFTISTGAVYSKKPYITNFSDYHQTSNISTSSYSYSAPVVGKVTPINVSADCRVLDIPVNIDYQVYNRSNNKFSIGSGLSSYIMLRENYHYNYNTTPGPSSPTDYDIANKNQHILGVLNLQATYARRLSSKFSLGVQPYLKVPLTDIGYSQVKLQSTGVAVGLTWNINSPPK